MWKDKHEDKKKTKSALEVFGECTEKFINTEGDKEKKTSIKRKVEGIFPKVSISKGKSFSEDGAMRLNSIAP